MKQTSDILRDVIRESGTTIYRLALDTGLDRMCISRFLRGSAITTGSFDRLCAHFGLTLTLTKDEERGRTQRKG